MTSSKSHISINNKYDRVIVLVDMDCFYCQVEEKLSPTLAGKPIAVVQYNTWQGGGIIAVNYPARAAGVTRHMRGQQAKEQCPEIELVSVPSVREKADLTKYREAGKEVANVLQTFTPLLERASVDEAYLDITEQVSQRLTSMNEGTYKLSPNELINTYSVGYENIGGFISEISSKFGKEYEIDDELVDDFEYLDTDLPAIRQSNLKLLIGASIASEIRAKVKEVTGYECSAGIAHNKILAKLACGINKPNKQTVLPLNQIPQLFRTLPVGKITGLGGKFGEEVCEIFKIKFLGDLLQFEESELQKKFDQKSGSWLYLIARGIDLEAVTPRFYSKSIGCCKKFPGRNAITGLMTLQHWFKELATEMSERLDKDIVENNRKAKQMVVSFIQEINSEEVSSSRSTPMTSYDIDWIATNAFEVLKKNTEQLFKSNSESVLNNPIKFLGISVGKFETTQIQQQNTLEKMFKRQEEEQQSKQKNILENSIESNDKVKVKEKKQSGKSFFMEHFRKKEALNDNCQEIENSTKENENLETKSFFMRNIKQKEQKQNDDSLSDDDRNKTIIKASVNSPAKNTSNLPSTSKRNSSEMVITDQNDLRTEDVQEIEPLDYTKTYAEFYRPETKPEDFIKCTQCYQKVLSYDLQTHLDGHLAFQLSQQQREEFRNEIKSSQTPPSKKLKTNSSLNSTLATASKKSTQSKKIIGNIDFFFKKPSRLEPNQDEVKCNECKCIVSKLKLHEHEDLHLAQKIQREWNSAAALENSNIST